MVKAMSILVALVVVTAAGAQVPLGPAQPTNLQVTGFTEDSVTLAWGPTQPGEFYFVDATRNSVTVGWGASLDNRSPVTYTISKNGIVVENGLTNLTYKLSVTRNVKTFRTCVTAQNQAGQSSPPACSTWNRVP